MTRDRAGWRTLVSVAGVAMVVAVAGCSDDKSASSAPVSSPASASAVPSTAPSQGGVTPPTPSASSRPCRDDGQGGLGGQGCADVGAPTQPGTTSPLPAQVISTATGTAKVLVRNSDVVAIRSSDQVDPEWVVVPITVDVTDGRVELGPSHWHLHTSSAQDVAASNTSGIAVAVGTASFDGQMQAVIPFSANTPTNGALTAGASIADISLTGDDGTELARWTFPQPVAVRYLPSRR